MKKRLATLVLSAGLLTCGAHAQQIGFALPADSAKVSFPIEIHNNLIVLPVIVNSQKVLRFILDTSVEHSVLTQKSLGDQMGFDYGRKFAMGKIGDRVVNGYVANGVELELPGGVATGVNHSIMVLDYDFYGLSDLAQTRIDGLIGYDVLSRFMVDINLTTKTMTLYAPGKYQVPKGYEAIPIVIEGQRPYLKADVIFENWDKVRSKMMIKTGAAHTFLFDSDSNVYHIPSLNLEVPLGKTPNGEIIGHVGRIRSLTIGKIQVENPVVSFTKQSVYGKDGSSIGMGFFSRFDLVIDYSRGELHVRKNREFAKSFEYDMSGVRIVESGRGAFEVVYVQSGCPAEKADVRVGDQVLAINGTQLTIQNFSALMSQLRDKPDKKVTIRLKRGANEFDASFKLVRFV
jgi:hypothetical protein